MLRIQTALSASFLLSLAIACSSSDTGSGDDKATSSGAGTSAPNPDLNGDGVADDLGMTIDADGDGIPDHFDIDGDGILDGLGVDTNGDGILDAIGLDTNGDGLIDALDLDGDGIADQESTSPPPGATGGSGNTGTVPPATGGGTAADGGPIIMGYVYKFDDHGGTAALDSVPFGNVDYVVHAFVTADTSTGAVVELEQFNDFRTAGLVEKAHAAGKKVILSLGGHGSTWQMDEIAGTALQETFVDNVVARVVEWGYDGVDFDYEFPGNNGPPEQFTGYMEMIRTKLKAAKPDALVMFGVSPGWWLDSYEWAKLASITDYAFYFCYDWSSPQLGPMTAPGESWGMQSGTMIEPSCRGAMDYIVSQGFPVDKIVTGLGFSATGTIPYSTATDAVKTGTPDPDSMEVLDNMRWWPNVTGTTMKVNAVLDPTQSVLTAGGTTAGVGFWHWGQDNVGAGDDLSSALRKRVDELK